MNDTNNYHEQSQLGNRIHKIIVQYGPIVIWQDYKIKSFVQCMSPECINWYLSLDVENLEDIVIADWRLILHDIFRGLPGERKVKRLTQWRYNRKRR